MGHLLCARRINMVDYEDWLISAGWTACQKCPLLVANRTQVVSGAGNTLRPLLYLLGEAPGATEDACGRPFSGKAGIDELNVRLRSIDVKREEIFIDNTCLCRPPKNRKPLPDEIANCKPRLVESIKMIAPHIIVAMGATPLFALTGKSAVGQNVGWGKSPIHERVYCTYHPASVFYGTDIDKKARRAAIETHWAAIGQAVKDLRSAWL